METPIKQKRTTKPKTLQISSYVIQLDDFTKLDNFEIACHVYYSDAPEFGLIESKAKSQRMKILKYISKFYTTIINEQKNQKEENYYNQLLNQYIRKIEIDFKDIHILKRE